MSDCGLQVIVLDDRSRFALHVWRYLSRSVGFGIGTVPLSGECDARSGAQPWPLETPAGGAVVSWVNIGGSGSMPGRSWEKDLRAIVAATNSSQSRIFLVDVRGDGSGLESEFWPRAFKELEASGVVVNVEDVWLVSSYGVGSREYLPARADRELQWDIRPKSVGTLQKLARLIWPERNSRIGSSNAGEGPQLVARGKNLHFLVTGAGFEFKSREWRKIRPLGVPQTDELLTTAYENSSWPKMGVNEIRGGEGAYPLPPTNLRPNDPLLLPVREASSERDLDKLWNALLMLMLEQLGPQGQDRYLNIERSSAERKVMQLDAEHFARESFRSAFLNYDWGHLTQALDAATLPWDVWLTTNYTQFVDRAVALHGHARKAGEGGPAWRILSIATEAELLIRRLFFGDRSSKKVDPDESFIFKLHGDLAHLSTMAIAGHDKEIFSPLTHSVGSLHWMYEAAGRWIERLIRSKEKPFKVYWHIVGHGLKDEVLVQTIRGVVDATSGPQVVHSFLFVQPEADKVLKKVKDIAESIGPFEPIRSGADRWMAMLAKSYRATGVLPEIDDKFRDGMDRRV